MEDRSVVHVTGSLWEKGGGVAPVVWRLAEYQVQMGFPATAAGMTDVQGRRLLDFHGNSLHQVGYNNPAVIEAVVEQIRQLPFCPRRYTNRAAVELGKTLTRLAPGDLDKLTLCPGGTEAAAPRGHAGASFASRPDAFARVTVTLTGDGR